MVLKTKCISIIIEKNNKEEKVKIYIKNDIPVTLSRANMGTTSKNNKAIVISIIENPKKIVSQNSDFY